MKGIAQSRPFWVQAVGAVAGSISAVVGSQFGFTANLVGLALALAIFSYTFSFTAGLLDPRGIRVRVVFLGLALIAWLAAAFAVILSAIHGI